MLLNYNKSGVYFKKTRICLKLFLVIHLMFF